MMRRHSLGALAGGLALAAASLLPATTASAAPAVAPVAKHPIHEVCGTPAKGSAHCLAKRRQDINIKHVTRRADDVSPAASTPSGYGPSSLQAAYGLTSYSSANGSGQTIAIVDAYNDPTAEADLGVYRSYYGLSSCTTSNGCFKKVSQTGSTTSLPSTDGGWAEEISLDLDMVSAIAPNAKIILVEATSASYANLGAAENEAAALGATEISNSWGGSDASDSTYGTYFNHSGIAITVSSGDDGYGVEYPASSKYVTAVGGTTLTASSSASRGYTETAWSDAGSGCSSYNTALSTQGTSVTGCSRRAVADVSADADPNTGVAVYDSTAYEGYSGWLEFGGTSASAPIIAGVYALAGNAASITPNIYPYSHTSYLNDITSGSNGSCSVSKLCTATTGWDGPTGMGTPSGIGAF
jgi:subtilase family serine protease